MVVEIGVFGVVIGQHPFDAVLLRRDFFSEQVEPVERAGYRAQDIAAVLQDGDRAIFIVMVDVIEVVLAIVVPVLQGVVAKEVVVGVAVVHLDHGLPKTGVAAVAIDPGQWVARRAGKDVALIEILDGFPAAHRSLDFNQAGAAKHLLVAETPGSFLRRRQDDGGDLTVAIELHLESGQRRAVGPAVRMQVQLDERTAGIALNAQQRGEGIADGVQQLAAVERNIRQADGMARRRADRAGQGDPLLAAAAGDQGFHQSGLVHHAVSLVALVMKVERVEFFLLDVRLASAAGDLEILAAAQGQHLVFRRELRQVQVPAHAEAGVDHVQRVELQLQRHGRTAESVALEFRHVHGHGVLARARIDAMLHKTHEVECIGMHGTGSSHFREPSEVINNQATLSRVMWRCGGTDGDG